MVVDVTCARVGEEDALTSVYIPHLVKGILGARTMSELTHGLASLWLLARLNKCFYDLAVKSLAPTITPYTEELQRVSRQTTTSHAGIEFLGYLSGRHNLHELGPGHQRLRADLVADSNHQRQPPDSRIHLESIQKHLRISAEQRNASGSRCPRPTHDNQERHPVGSALAIAQSDHRASVPACRAHLLSSDCRESCLGGESDHEGSRDARRQLRFDGDS